MAEADGAVRPAKLIIAVHGIGDQTGYETIQSVAARVGAYYGVAPAIPLGRFYPTPPEGEPAQPSPVLMVNPPDPKQLAELGLGFAEVYWAPIARQVARDGYILEETRHWAKTIAVRVAAHGINNRGWQRRDVDRLVTVLDELVHAVFVLERLTVIADKAGIFTFDLARLLVDFAGDVQIVADFESYRQQILRRFDNVMTSALALTDPASNPELYVVAHSEGSVVAFLSLLHALNDPGTYPWIRNVRGLMTIGSPIEIHHLLWPELWRERRPGLPPLAPSSRIDGHCVIPWRNYIDYADPIAYELDATTQWLRDRGFAAHLPLQETTFRRSYLPGKAHVEYWDDEAVFGHFIETIVHPTHATRGRYLKPPPDRPLAGTVSWLAPQALMAVLLMLAVWLIYRPVTAALDATTTPLGVGRDVAGIGLLMLAVTAAARIPRLMDRQAWWPFALGVLIPTTIVYANLTCPSTQVLLGGPFAAFFNLPDLPIRLALPDFGCNAMPAGVRSESSALALMLIAGTVSLISGVAVHVWPRRGGLLLPAIGLLTSGLLIVVILVANGTQPDVQMWPVVAASAVFFYLWWLTALLFDLTFVWQRYIRASIASGRLAWLAAQKTGQPG